MSNILPQQITLACIIPSFIHTNADTTITSNITLCLLSKTFQKKRRHRRHVILELFYSEEKFVQQLEQLVTTQHWLAGLSFFPDDAPYLLAEIDDGNSTGDDTSPGDAPTKASGRSKSPQRMTQSVPNLREGAATRRCTCIRVCFCNQSRQQVV